MNNSTVTPGSAPIRLEDAVQAWGSDAFRQVLKQELERLDASVLPLQQGLARSSAVADDGFEVMVVSVDQCGSQVGVRAGVFYRGVIGGCSCADDPTPMDTIDEYCLLDIRLDIASAHAQITLAAE